MVNNINIGVVGIGKLGTFHIQKLLNISNVNLVGIHDLDKELMRKHAEKYNITAFDEVDRLMEECDAITIATPTIEHFNVSKCALEKGLHIFIEKPITYKLEDAFKINDIAKQNNKIVQVGHIERFNSAFTESLNYIDNPQFIEIHRISPFPNRSLDIPVVMDIMIHDLDILLSIAKNDLIKKIDATGASVVTDFIDLANARIEFDSGLVANLTASRISAKQMRKVRIFQPKSYLGIDLLDKKIDFFEIIDGKDDLIDSKTLKFDNSDALENELSHFIDCIRNNKKPLVGAEDGIAALELGLKIEELINQKRGA
tara:strand:- start:780 stop:1721 length:942 start_codon:yes stop_codon:yes gene_type:complete